MIEASEAHNVEQFFTYHAPTGDQPARYGKVRDAAKALAMTILESCPSSADRAAAIRLLRECVMTANASIALEGKLLSR